MMPACDTSPLQAFGLSPGLKVLEVLLISRRIQAQNRFPGLDAFDHKVLVDCHFKGLFRDLISDFRWNDDNAIGIADKDVTWKHRRIPTSDWHVDINGLMQGQVRRGRR